MIVITYHLSFYQQLLNYLIFLQKLYDEYQEALKKLNVNKLFKEEPLLENKIQGAI